MGYVNKKSEIFVILNYKGFKIKLDYFKPI